MQITFQQVHVEVFGCLSIWVDLNMFQVLDQLRDSSRSMDASLDFERSALNRQSEEAKEGRRCENYNHVLKACQQWFFSCDEISHAQAVFDGESDTR